MKNHDHHSKGHQYIQPANGHDHHAIPAVDNMKKGHKPHMGMVGHNHHAMMIADFKKRFYVVLLLAVPVMLSLNIYGKTETLQGVV